MVEFGVDIDIDIDVEVDIDNIGRKELQALAKKFGLKANQKSAILRDELRGAIEALDCEQNQSKGNRHDTVIDEDDFDETKEKMEREEEVEVEDDNDGEDRESKQDLISPRKKEDDISVELKYQEMNESKGNRHDTVIDEDGFDETYEKMERDDEAEIEDYNNDEEREPASNQDLISPRKKEDVNFVEVKYQEKNESKGNSHDIVIDKDDFDMTFEQMEQVEEAGVEDHNNDKGEELVNKQDMISPRTKEDVNFVEVKYQQTMKAESKSVPEAITDLKLCKENQVAKERNFCERYPTNTEYTHANGQLLLEAPSEETSIGCKSTSTMKNRNDGRHYVGIINSTFVATIAGNLYDTDEVVESENSVLDEYVTAINGISNDKELFRDTKGTSEENGKIQSVSKHEPEQGKEKNDTVELPSNILASTASKIPLVSKTSSINNHLEYSSNTRKKFSTKLDQLHRTKKNITKNGKAPETNFQQVIGQRQKTSISHPHREVPLWKIHSRDFIRKRDDSNPKKIHPPKKNADKREPLRNCSNDKVGSNSETKNIIKKSPLKTMRMSKRNEDHMKKYVERQSKGRKYKAEKDKIKMYANFARNPIPDALNHI